MNETKSIKLVFGQLNLTQLFKNIFLKIASDYPRRLISKAWIFLHVKSKSFQSCICRKNVLQQLADGAICQAVPYACH